MSELPVFGRKAFTATLLELGFEIIKGLGKGSHTLAKHPTRKPDHNQRPFVVIKQDKTYQDSYFRSTLIREVCAFGFQKEFVKKEIRKNL